MEAPKLRSEIVREVHEHEVFLAFVNDADAVAFHEWWNDQGFKLFKKWAEDKWTEE